MRGNLNAETPRAHRHGRRQRNRRVDALAVAASSSTNAAKSQRPAAVRDANGAALEAKKGRGFAARSAIETANANARGVQATSVTVSGNAKKSVKEKEKKKKNVKKKENAIKKENVKKKEKENATKKERAKKRVHAPIEVAVVSAQKRPPGVRKGVAV